MTMKVIAKEAGGLCICLSASFNRPGTSAEPMPNLMLWLLHWQGLKFYQTNIGSPWGYLLVEMEV